MAFPVDLSLTFHAEGRRRRIRRCGSRFPEHESHLCLTDDFVPHFADALGLADFAARRPHLLSGGEKRRLSIAGVLAMQPKVIVFDEPFSNLDYSGVRQVLGQMVDLHRSGRTVLATTHDLDKVLAHADRLVVMQRGRIVQDGAPAAVAAGVEPFGVRCPQGSLERLSWLN